MNRRDFYQAYATPRCLGLFCHLFTAFGLAVVALLHPANLLGAEIEEPLVSKRPQPAQAQLELHYRRFREAFQDEITTAKSTVQKKAFAAECRRVAGLSTDDLEQYVLLDEARKYLAECGDLDGVNKVLEEMAGKFRLDRDQELIATVLETVAQWDSATSAAAAHTLASRVDEAASSGNDALAAKFLGVAVTAARKGRVKELVNELIKKQKGIEDRVKQSEKYEKALLAVANDPTDQEAHLLIGSYRCFVQSDWPRGLPHLARSSDAALSAAARKELAATSAKNACDAAEAWFVWAAAQKTRERESWRSAAELHARSVLTNELDNLPALERVRAEKLLLSAGAGEPGKTKPSAFAGLVLWLDAADAESLRGPGLQAAAIGSEISSWKDRSGSGLKAESSGQKSGSPVLSLLAESRLPAITFDGTDDTLTIAKWPQELFASAGLTTLAVVAIPPAVPARSNLFETILDNRHDLGGGFVLHIRGDQQNGPLEYSSWPPSDEGTPKYSWARQRGRVMVLAGVSTARDDALFVNGALAARSARKQLAPVRDMIILGGWQSPYMNTPGRHFGGQIAEVLVYRRSLAAPELDALTKSLSAKWTIK